jgi:hypothetical protein
MFNNKTFIFLKNMGGGELSVALVLILLSLFGWWETTKFEVDPGMVKTMGPAMFPQILFGGIIIFSTFLIFQILINKSKRSEIVWGKWQKAPLAAVIMLFQALTFEELSTFVSAGITLPLLLWIAGVRLKIIIIVTLIFMIFVYFFFILALRVPLPMQFLPTLLG